MPRSDENGSSASSSLHSLDKKVGNPTSKSPSPGGQTLNYPPPIGRILNYHPPSGQILNNSSPSGRTSNFPPPNCPIIFGSNEMLL